MYHLSEAYLMASYICVLAAFLGALSFGTVVSAPMDIRIHRFAVLTGLLLTLLCTVGSFFSAVPTVYAALMVAIAGLMTVSFFAGMRLAPAVADAQATNDQPRLARLGWLSATALGLGVLAGLMLLVGLVYVLPGQFTFWPPGSTGLSV